MTDDPLQVMRERHRYEAEETYTDDEDEKRIDAVNRFLKDNEMLHNNLLEIYDSATEEGGVVPTVKLFRRVHELVGSLVSRLRDAEEEGLADKLESEYEAMSPLYEEISEREMDKTERLTYAPGHLVRLVDQYGLQMRQYSFMIVSGTHITNESKGRGRGLGG